jgi:hypothetical protein
VRREYPTVVYIRPRGVPIIFILLAPLHSGDTTCKHTTYKGTPESRVLRSSKRPEPAENRPTLSSSCLWHEPSSYNLRHRSTQKHHEGTLGVQSDTKHRQPSCHLAALPYHHHHLAASPSLPTLVVASSPPSHEGLATTMHQRDRSAWCLVKEIFKSIDWMNDLIFSIRRKRYSKRKMIV